MITEKDISIIEDYLNHRLDLSQRRSVEDRMKSDPEFAEHMELMGSMKTALVADTEQLRQDLAEVFESEAAPSKKSPVKKMPIGRWLVAASIVSLIALSTWISIRTTMAGLYANYFEVPMENISLRESTQLDPNLRLALDAYNRGNHQDAQHFFGLFLESEPNRTDVLFYRSVSLMAIENHVKAAESLEQISEGESVFTNAAKWYLSLCLLQLDQEQESVRLLSELKKDTTGKYAEKASKLLRQLP